MNEWRLREASKGQTVWQKQLRDD